MNDSLLSRRLLELHARAPPGANASLAVEDERIPRDIMHRLQLLLAAGGRGGEVGRDRDGDDGSRESGRTPVKVASPLLKGVLNGAALGLVAALLYVALDPNLSPHPGTSFARSAPRMVAGFAVAAVLVAAVCMALPVRPWARWLGRAIAILLPLAGVGLCALSSPAMPWTFTLNRAGAIVTGSDLAFVGAIALLLPVLARPLLRWADTLVEAQPGRARWYAPAAGAVLAASLLLVTRLPGRTADPKAVAFSPSTTRRVVLIGIDGAEWSEIRPLVEAGRLPTFERLLREGASGSLSTFRPVQSPTIWTTVATGQTPLRHGIHGFLEPETQIPYTSNTRRVPALWTVLGDRGISVGVVGWWVTWPAEAVNGHVVSSYSAKGQGTIKGTFYEGLSGQTHPPELVKEIEPLVFTAIVAGRDELQSILRYYKPHPEDTGFRERVRIGSWVLGADRVFSSSSVYIARRYAPRFLAVYLSAPDTNAHLFCHSNPWRSEICGRILGRVYQRVDQQLGEILEAVGSDSTVIVVSDHGFDRARGHEHGLLHGPPGIIVLRGNGVLAGATIRAASVYDVAPTIVALFGLPVAQDLRGRVLLSAFEPGFVERWRISFGPSWDSGLDPAADAPRPIPSPTDGLIEERLRALGYIE